MAYLRRSPPLFFIPLSPSNLRPFGAPPSIGRRECPREPLPLEGAAERSEAGLASFFCGARVLSFIACLRRSSSSLFHTARTLSGSLRSPPSPRGEGFISGIPLSPSNLRPFGAPPSIGRRECPREPLPLEGAAERSEAGLASFLRRSRLLFAFLIGKGDRASGARVLSLTAYLRRSFPLFFLPLVPYPARSARHLPHAGKALFRGQRCSRIVAFPIGEGGPRQRWIGCSRKRRT